MIAFSFYGVNWFNALKDLISNNIPVIVLTEYKVGHNSGHYRVVVGYDDTKQDSMFYISHLLFQFT